MDEVVTDDEDSGRNKLTSLWQHVALNNIKMCIRKNAMYVL
jgi:hypothetical protein